MNWTDERVELLKKLWAEGLSASQIAAQLGSTSRSAVLGKVHRLKLGDRDKTVSALRQKPKKAESGMPKTSCETGQKLTSQLMNTVEKPIQNSSYTDSTESVFKQVLRPPENNVIRPTFQNLQLVELTEEACKWPNGDPTSDEFGFCGNDSSDSGPYCVYHSSLAYQPRREQRRHRE